MMQHIAVKDHEDSLLPEGNWNLVWNDEFDGTELDRTKWGFRLNFWGKPFPAFTTEGVELDGQSHLRLHVVKKGDQYCSPHLQTGSLTYDIPQTKPGFWPFGPYEKPLFMHRYGYYEICCRLNRQAGWWTAFWLQSPSVGAHPNPVRAGVECDIMESQDYPEQGIIRCGNLWNGYGPDAKGSGHRKYKLKETPGYWHRFGVDWSPDGYVFYTDGEEVNRVDGPVSQTEQFILVSTECMGYRNTPSKPDPALDRIVFPEYFEVDHVRVFDRK
jgi:beta-glucanase (GH16 family)